MFSVNSYAKIKEILETKEKYTVGKISISKKDGRTGKYETDFIATVRFVGNAHLQRPMKDQKIKITSCGVSNCYVKDDKVEFTTKPTYVIFGYELADGQPTASPVMTVASDNDDVLPF